MKPARIKADLLTTLEESKQHFSENIHQGVICPVCNRYAKIYKRQITSSMAYALILIYRYYINSGKDFFQWIHLEDYFKTLKIPSKIRGDVPKLRFWGLVEKMNAQLEDGNRNSGYYRITDVGQKFVTGQLKVSKCAEIYNDKLLKFSSELTDIHQSLKNKFNYNELMQQNLKVA